MTSLKSGAKIRVLLIDDHSRIHEAVITALSAASDIELVGHGGTGQEAIHLCETLAPDIVLMDVMMPAMNGAEATRRIHEAHPAIKILVLSSFQDDDSIRSMLAQGAVGYVLKGSLATDLASTIRTTQLGQAVFSAEVAQVILNQPKAPAHDFGLTDRELEVLKLMSAGLNNGEIAAQLFISQSTVKFHINNIIHKMGVETRTEALVIAAKNGIV